MSNNVSRARSLRPADGFMPRSAAHSAPRRAAPHLNTLAHALLGAGFLSPLLIALPMPVHAQALPSGLQVMSGQASVSTQGAQMTVRNSPNAILNWRSFSVGAGQGVHFEQASAASKVLNRVTGGESSQIFGALTSNGQVWLLNPNGVLFGRDARVDVNSLVVSTLRLNDSDFLAGRYRFTASAPGATVRNEGAMASAHGGQVVMIGERVENAGSITAAGGAVGLAAASSVELVDTGLPNLAVRVQVPAGQALNTGLLSAPGGRVDVFGAIVNQQGIVRADSIGTDAAGQVVLGASQGVTLAEGSVTSADGGTGGTVRVDAGQGTASVAGAVSAQGATGQGGRIDALGARVELLGQASLDASGTAGGGGIRVGGGYQGQEADVANAALTTVAPNVRLAADARARGDGGRVIVWADDTARVHGHISARGGPQGGDGGFIETSGKRLLEVTRPADASAPAGRGGTWLLDPTDVTIGTINLNVIGEPNYVPIFEPASVSAAAISTALSAGTSVSVTTGASGSQGGDITVASAITMSGSTDATLTLNAHRDINLNSSIIASGGAGKLNLTLNSDTSGSGTGRTYLRSATVGLNGGALTATSNGGKVTLVNGSTFTFNNGNATIGQFNLDGGTLNGTGNLTVTGAMNFTTNNVTIGGSGTLTTQGTTTLNMSLSDRWVALANTREWINQGTVNMSGDDYFVLLDSSKFTIASGASFNYTGADPATPSGNPGPGTATAASRWTNRGTITINSSNPLQDNGFTDSTFDNFGTVNFLTRFALTAPASTADTGTYNIANGSQFTLGGTRTFDTASRISGAGTLIVQAGTQTVNGAIDVSRFQMTGGTLNGTGSFTVGSNYSRTGGTLGTTFSGINITQASGNLTPGFLQAGAISLTTQDPASTMLLDAGLNSSGNMTLNAAGSLQILASPTAASFVQAGGDQTVTADSLVLRGASSGASRFARLQAANTQTVSARAITLEGGAGGGGVNTGNSASIRAGRTQSITAGFGGITLTGGGGALPDNTDNYVYINLYGTQLADSQSITINNGGNLTITGGSSAKMVGAPNGSAAGIYATGGQQTITMSGGAITLVGGTVGGHNNAYINSGWNTPGIQGASQRILGDPTITLIGGASGGSASIANSANSASIVIESGTQVINARSITMTGGGGAVGEGANGAYIRQGSMTATSGTQTITTMATGGITMTGGSGSSANARIHSYGTAQSISIGSGGLRMTGGSGSDTNNAAHIEQLGTAGTQTLTIAGGSALLQGGSSSKQNVGGTGFGSRASIYSEGSAQLIDFTAGGGDLTLIGGTVGSRNFAQIYAEYTGTQTIRGVNALTMTGGSSGGTTAEHNGANIQSTAGTQSVSAASLVMTGGSGGVNNFAMIAAGNGNAATQTVSIAGNAALLAGTGGQGNYAAILGQGQTLSIGDDLSLRGQSGGATAAAGSGVRIGASTMSGATSAADLALTVGGSLSLTGGSAARAGAGLANAETSLQPLNLNLTVGRDITLTAGSAADAPVGIGRYGTNSVASGNAIINATNGTLTTGAGTGLNPGGTLTVNARTLDLAGSASGTSVALSGSAGALLRSGTTITAREGGTNPLIVDAGGGAFVNQAGTGVFSIPSGTRWLVYSNNPDADTLGGLLPDFKQYGAFYGITQPTGTGNGALYRQSQTQPSDAPTNVTTVAVASAVTAVAIPTQMSTPTRGRVLDAVPALAGTTTTGGVEEITATEAATGSSGSGSTASGSGGTAQVAFRSVSVGQMSRAELQTLLAARAEYKKKVFASAISSLEVNPALADVRPCENEAELEQGDCLVTDELRKYVQETREVRKLARESRRAVRQAAVPEIERKVAVLIGNDNYADRTIPTLENAGADAKAVGRLLQETLGYDTVLLTDATKQSVIRTLNRLALETGPNDSVIVYYAGHGEAIENGKTGYWIMNDSTADRPQSWLSNGDVSRLLGRISAKQLMLVSDSCFSGAFVGGERVTRPNAADPRGLLDRKAAVVMSSGGNEPVSDDGREGHSSFAWHFMDLLRKVRDWNLGVSVFETLKTEVSKDVPQTPQYGASRFAGHEGNTDYLFERREVEKARQ